MKKLLLTSVALVALTAAGPAFAQTAQPVEPGDKEAATYFSTEDTSEEGNQSRVAQGSDGNDAVVNQNGRNGISVINQNGAAGAGLNQANVTQNGDGANHARIDQASTDENPGFGNAGAPDSLAVERDPPAGSGVPAGFRQVATITQTNSDAAGEANAAVIRQGVSGVPGNNNEAGITQSGAGNDALVEQAGGTNAADANMISLVDQSGDDNIVENIQGESDYSNVEQNGSRNGAYVDQRYENGITNRSSDVFQDGDDNVARVTQTADGAGSTIIQGGTDATSNRNLAINSQTGGADNAIAVVQQDGDDNQSRINQTGSATANVRQVTDRNTISDSRTFDTDDFSLPAGSGGANGSASGIQHRSNISVINQSADGAVADIDQTGELNRSAIAQSDAATATVIQRGVFQTSRIVQSGAAEAMVTQDDDGNGRNVSEVTQTADGALADVNQKTSPANSLNFSPINESYVLQTADTSAFVDQVGIENVSDINQSGTGDGSSRGSSAFAASVTQLGDSGDSRVVQSGADNEAVLRQEAVSFNEESEITQSGFDNLAVVTQSGENNFSDVLQDGVGNQANVTQGGDANVSNVTQTGSGNLATVTQGPINP